MDKSFLTEAFKELDALNEETFDLTEIDAPIELKRFADGQLDDPTIDIIDVNAETEDELADSYVGKVIIECDVCHSKIYKDLADVHIDEEHNLANIGEECPYCYSSDGYKIIGKVAPFKEDDEVKVEVEDKPVEETNAEEAPIEEPKEDEKNNESLTEAKEDICPKCGKNPCECVENEECKGDDCNEATIADKVRAALARRKHNDVKAESCEEEINEDEQGDAFLDKVAEKVIGESVNEDFEKVDVETKDQVIHVSSEEKPVEEGAEMIEPLDTEDKHEIDTEVDKEVEDDLGLDTNVEEKPAEDVDYDVDEFDEDSFDGLGEGYLKKVYDNVESFKTSKVSSGNNSIIVEGVIKFTSGKEKATSFIFESSEATKSGKVKFTGLNKQISRGKKSFSLTGSIKDNKFISESLSYSYRAKDENGKTARINGTVKL